MQESAHKDRIVTLDIMKGIGILLMIAGHCNLLPDSILKWIFTFHMPLFFLISGFLFKPNPDFKRYREKSTRRLLYPYLFTSIVLILISLFSAIKNSDMMLFTHQCMSVLFPTSIYPDWMLDYFGWAGTVFIWFLFALFWCRLFMNRLIQLGAPLWAIIIIGAAASFADRYLINLPFAFLQGISAMTFYAIGYWGASHKIKWYHISICLACWVFSFLFSNLDMRCCLYDIYPLDVLGACGGTLFISFIATLFSRQRNIISKTLTVVLSWVGRLSLAILCIHAITFATHPFSFLHIEEVWYSQLLIHTSLPLFIAYFFTKIPFTRRIFGIEDSSACKKPLLT